MQRFVEMHLQRKYPRSLQAAREVRELVRLLAGGDVREILDDSAYRSHYAHLDLKHAILVLEKVRDEKVKADAGGAAAIVKLKKSDAAVVAKRLREATGFKS